VYYATFQGALYSCPKTGCTTFATLTTALNSPDAILYDGASGYLFVADTYNNAVEAFTTAGAQVFKDTGQSNAFSLAADASYVYWGMFGGIVRSSRDGQTTAQIATNVSQSVVALAIDSANSKVYGATLGTTGTLIQTTPSSTGAWSYFGGTDVHGQANIQQMVLHGGNLYFITQGTNPAMYTNGGVYVCPTSGCTQPMPVAGANPLTQGTCLMSDANNLYYVADGKLYRCAFSGCAGGGTLLASNVYPLQGASCAQDATSFYFLSTSSVIRVAK
jgi:hypothetical protein